MLSLQLHFLLNRECFDKITNVMKHINFLIIFLGDIFVLNVIRNLPHHQTELSCPRV